MEMKTKTAKVDTFAFLLTAGISLVVLSIVLAFGQNILNSFKTSFTSGTYEYNTTVAGQVGMDNIAQKQGLLGLVIVVIAIIGLLISGFAFKMRG